MTDAQREAEAAANRPERLKRKDPKRVEPIRSVGGYFRDSQSWPENPEQAPPARDPTNLLDDAVTQGVRLGYRVIDEHIQLGRRTAENLRPGGEPVHGTPNADEDIDDLVKRLQRVYQDVGALCFDALDAVARTPALLKWFMRKDAESPEPASPGRGAAETASAAPMAVDVQSARRVVITTSGTIAANPAEPPRVHALHGPDPSVAPLTDLAFVVDGRPPNLLLRLRVPERQPPGLYTGVVVDAATNAPLGTLTVRVFD